MCPSNSCPMAKSRARSMCVHRRRRRSDHTRCSALGWIELIADPRPSAVSRVLLSLFCHLVQARRSTSDLPSAKQVAWNRRSRPCLALPPALSPSPKKIPPGGRARASASLPVRLTSLRPPCAVPLARLRAASRAAEPCAFSLMRRSACGFSSERSDAHLRRSARARSRLADLPWLTLDCARQLTEPIASPLAYVLPELFVALRNPLRLLLVRRPVSKRTEPRHNATTPSDVLDVLARYGRFTIGVVVLHSPLLPQARDSPRT